jgi:predicted ATPase
MRVATWAIQERERILSDARARLRPEQRPAGALDAEARAAGAFEDLLEVVHRAFVACLSGATVHPATILELRRAWGERALLVAAQGMADALGVRAEARAAGDQALVAGERQEIGRSLAAVGKLFAPDRAEAPELDIDVVEAPRPTLVHALTELAAPAPASLEARGRSLLRVRATSVAAARALEEARGSLQASGLALHGSSPDELLISVGGEAGEGVERLVRTASGVARGLAGLVGDLRFAIVHAEDGHLEAAVRAGSLASRPGLLILDDAAWAAAGAGLAAVPGLARAVDPLAAFDHDRWELSALLVRPPFLGRDAEVERISRLLLDPSEVPVLVAVHGPAGIGKTGVVRSALGAAGYDDESAPVLWGAADPVQPTPWAAVAAMLRALAGSPPGHPRAAARVGRLVEGLAASLGEEDRRELESLLPLVITLVGAEEEPGVEDRSQRSLRVGLKRALYLTASAMLARADDGRPAVFVVPGAESVDGPTRDAIAFAAARLRDRARVVLVSSTRLRLPSAFESMFRVVRIEVNGLAAPAARALAGALLDRPDADEALGALVEKARGSPLALIHGVRLAVEGGLLRRRDDRWDAAEVEARDIPGRLDRLLRARVERLPDDSRRLLVGCAMLGVSFLPAAAELVGIRLGLNREAVSRGLAFLVDTGFLVRTQSRPGAPLFPDAFDDERPLAFEHPLLRRAAEGTAPPGEKKQLHGIAAEALEAVMPAGIQALAPTLARHHRLAGRREEALERLTVAARRSARLDDRQGAVAFAREGIELAGEDAVAAFPFHLELEAIRHGGPRGAHRDALRQLVRVADKSGAPELRGHALVRVARFNLAAGDPVLAEESAAQAIAELTRAGPTPQRARLETQALRLLSLARLQHRDLEGAAAALAHARSRTPLDDRRALGPIEQQEGLMLLERGDAVGAVERLLLARAHHIAMADAAGEAACIDAVALAYFRRDRLATALTLLELAARLRDRMGDDAGRAWVKKTEAEVLFTVGDDEAAFASAQEARALAHGLTLDRLEAASALVCARIHLRRGELEVGERIVDGIRRRSKDVVLAIEAALAAARIRLARAAAASGGARERALKVARTRAREAVELGEAHGVVAGQLLGMAAAGEALLLEGEPGAALPWAQQAVELLEHPGAWAVPAEEVLVIYGRVLEAIGDGEEAAAVMLRARSLLEVKSRHLPPAARERFWSVPARAALRPAEPPAPLPAEPLAPPLGAQAARRPEGASGRPLARAIGEGTG